MNKKGNTVDISFMNIEPPLWCGNAGEAALKALDALDIAGWELSILFCDDDFIAELNGKYRSKPEPTDVLSFSQNADDDFPAQLEFPAQPEFPAAAEYSAAAELNEEADAGTIIAGDIVISAPALERNASDAGISGNEELVRLIVHGILHLYGMDHEEKGSNMLAVQDDIIKKISGGLF